MVKRLSSNSKPKIDHFANGVPECLASLTPTQLEAVKLIYYASLAEIGMKSTPFENLMNQT